METVSVVCCEDSPQTASSSPRGQSGTPLHTCDTFTQVRLSQEKPPTHGGIWSDPGGRTQRVSTSRKLAVSRVSCEFITAVVNTLV